MLHVSIRQIHDGKVNRLRSWLAELETRDQEVRETFEREGVRSERAYILESGPGAILVWISEVDDATRAAAAFSESKLSIDLQHRDVIDECLGERLASTPSFLISA